MAFERLIQLTLRARNFLSKDVEPASDSMKELAEEGRRLKTALEEAGRARGLARTLRDNQQATEGLERAQLEAAATLEDLTREIGDQEQATAGQRIALREARRTLDEAERAYKRNQQAIKNTTSELQKLGVDTDNAAAEEKRLTGELEDGKKALADNREAIKQKRVEEKKAADAAKEHADRVGTARGVMADAGKKVLAFAAAYVSLNAAFNLVRGGLNLVRDGIRAVIADGSSNEQALAQLESALASTGNAAGLTAQQLLDMADEFKRSSMLSTEEILSAQTRLLSYTDIVASEFPAAMQIVIDQQQRLGISVEQSAEIVGRALQSPSEAIATLGRQGFKFEAGQKALLKQLEATGRKAEAQAIIMDMLTEAYGGAAAAARMNTFAGLLKTVGDQFGDFAGRVADSGAFEYVRGKLQQVADELDAMANDGRLDQLAQGLSDAFVQGAEWVEGFVRSLADVDFKKLTDDAARWLDTFGEKLDTTGRWITMITAPIRTLVNVATGGIAAIGVAFTGLVTISLSGMALLAKAIPNAFGGEKIVKGLESARDTAAGMFRSLAGQVVQDGQDIADTWESVALAAESSANRQVEAAKRAANHTRQAMQENGDSIASFFRSNITSLEGALAAISFSETAADLAEVEEGLKRSKLSADEMAQAMEALGQKRGFVTVGEDVDFTADKIAELRLQQKRLAEEYFSGTRSLESWQQGHNEAAEAIRKLSHGVGEAVLEINNLQEAEQAFNTASSVTELRAFQQALLVAYRERKISLEEYQDQHNRATKAIRELGGAASGAKESVEELEKAQDKLGSGAEKAATKLDKAAGSLEEQRRAIGEHMEATRRGLGNVGDATEEAATGMNWFAEVLTRARTPLAELSEAALAAFDAMQGINSVDRNIDTSSIDKTAESLKKAKDQALAFQGALDLEGSRASGLGRWMMETFVRSEQVKAAFLEQKLALQSLMQSYESGSISTQQFAAQAASARRNLDLLDESDLSGLESAIEAANQKMRQLGDSARSTLEGLQMELLQLKGTEEEIEKARFAARRRELQAQQAEARQSGDQGAVANLQRALDTLAEIERETANQRELEKRQKRADEAARAAAPVPQQPQATKQPSKVIRLEARGQAVDVGVNSAADETRLLSILESAGLRSR